MNIKKGFLLFVQFCCLLMVYTSHSKTIYAIEKKSTPLRIVIQVNNLNQMPVVKEALINSLIDYNTHPELLGNIDYDSSELKAVSLNLSKTGKQKTAVQLKVKTNKQLSENKLFNNTLSATVEFEVRDTEAPVITSSKDVISRSINAELNPYEHLTVTDNYSDPVTIDYTTDYNNQEAGEYSITYTATDKAGNSSTLTLPIRVKNQVYLDYGTDESQIQEMLNLINDYRAAYQLEPYELADANAQHAIGVRAAEARRFLSHDRPNGTRYRTAFDEYGVNYSNPFEILAHAGNSPLDNLNWWKQSKNHNARLLSSSSNKIAIGYCDGLWAAVVYQN